jgi:hypothetical protein
MLAVQVIFLALSFFCLMKASEKRPRRPQDNREHLHVIPICSKQFAQSRTLLSLLVVHVPSVRRVPRLDDPYFPGSAICLIGTNVSSVQEIFDKREKKSTDNLPA